MTVTEINQKFAIGDVVKEATAFGRSEDTFSRRKGVIKDFKIIKNKSGSRHMHYEVLWEGHTATTLRAQHRLAKTEN